MDIFTTKSLIVPECRRPPQPKKSWKIKEKNRKQTEPKTECVEKTKTRKYVSDDGKENLFTGLDLEVVDNLDDLDEDQEWNGENFFEDFESV